MHCKGFSFRESEDGVCPRDSDLSNPILFGAVRRCPLLAYECRPWLLPSLPHLQVGRRWRRLGFCDVGGPLGVRQPARFKEQLLRRPGRREPLGGLDVLHSPRSSPGPPPRRCVEQAHPGADDGHGPPRVRPRQPEQAPQAV